MARIAHDIAACIHDERPRRQQRLDLLKQEGAFLAARDQTRRGRVQRKGCAFDLSRQRGDARLARGLLGPQRAQRALPSSAGAASRSPQPPARGRPSMQVGSGVGSSSASMRSASSRRPIRSRRRTSRLRACAALTRSPCASSVARAASSALAGQAKVARDERDLGLGDDTPARGPRPLSDRRRALHVAGEPLLERDRRAAPSRCLAARAQGHRRAGRPASMRRGDHLPRARAPRP